MFEQRQMLQQGVEVAVATPGRLIDLLKSEATNCRRVSYVVIDEVDKMFSLGFESQIRGIIGRIRSDRQMAMFSATMSAKIESIASETMADFVRISIGNVHLSNADVTQYVEVLRDEDSKMEWLSSRIRALLRRGLVIVFCRSKAVCERLARDLNNDDVASGVIHGDKLQNERQRILDSFRKGTFRVLVATDVASRGVNVVGIKTVVNFDCPFNLDSYIHRVGRTGRGGDTEGVAYTLLTVRGDTDRKMASQLLGLLRKLRMVASPMLEKMVRGHFDREQPPAADKGPGRAARGRRTRAVSAPHAKRNGLGAVQPLMSSFVKSSEKAQDGEDDALRSKTKSAYISTDGATHVFDEDAPLPSDIERRKRKKRWN